MKKISIKGNLTSSRFYLNTLSEVERNLESMEDGEQIAMDLQLTDSIDAMVIPNLLNLGLILLEKTGIATFLTIPSLDEKIKLKRYLKSIKFFDLCDIYEIFELNSDNSKISSYDSFAKSAYTTFVFENNYDKDREGIREIIEQDIFNKFTQKAYPFFASSQMTDFLKVVSGGFINVIETFCRASCINTCIHSSSYAILTLQANKDLKKVCISTADAGVGLYDSFLQKIKNKGYKTVSLESDDFIQLSGVLADKYAIVEALTYRFHNKQDYGLYHILMATLKSKGTMRIHSNSIWIVLTKNRYKELSQVKSKEDFAKKILRFCECEYVLTKTPSYQGVHIEIEIPFNSGNGYSITAHASNRKTTKDKE